MCLEVQQNVLSLAYVTFLLWRVVYVVDLDFVMWSMCV